MKTQQFQIGMVGLGVMERNPLLNMADHGHSVAGYDKDAAKVAALREEAENRDIRGATDIKEFIALLRKPRAVMMLVPAGPPVDSVINNLLAHLQPGDLIMDAGNSYFKDTDVRSAHDDVCFDRIEPAFQRYVAHPVASKHEIWSFRHTLRRMSQGKTLRLILTADATISWSTSGWVSTNKAEATHVSALNEWFADLPTAECPGGSEIDFTFFWKDAQRQEGRNYSVAVSGPK